ncbi:MAG TPA: hypothetical protein VD994_17310, partial [Prosthecobacter sp.]|nr:hypothetical protein [Prosthecobacter sp.]
IRRGNCLLRVQQGGEGEEKAERERHFHGGPRLAKQRGGAVAGMSEIDGGLQRPGAAGVSPTTFVKLPPTGGAMMM